MRILLAGVAAIALGAAPAGAEPGGGGNHAGKGGAKAEGSAKGGGPHAQHGQAHGPIAKDREKAARLPGPKQADRAEGTGKSNASSAAKGNGRNNGGRNNAGKNNADRHEAQEGRGAQSSAEGSPAVRAQDRVEKRDRITDRVLSVREEARPFRWVDAPRSRLVDGCPPGLAKKNNGCTPPGLAKGNPWSNLFSRPDWWGYRDWRDGRTGYYDGYLLRYNGNRIASFIPLLGGALTVGELWPDYYQPVDLPPYYRDFYGLGPSYRYADNVLYRVDPETMAISSIAALLTGDDIMVGQRLPDYYSVYNVPLAYRSRYADGPDALYRYSDGYVYRVDPATRLVQAAIELLL